MKIIFFSAKKYDEEYFRLSNKYACHSLKFTEVPLNNDTISLITDEQVACVFVNDVLDYDVLFNLSKTTIKLIALRCAGFNNIDIKAAQKLGFTVVNVPAYSPNAVAEHTVSMMLALNRNIHRAYSRVRDGNFSLEGLLGYDFNGHTIGIIGTGRIGSIVAQIMQSMGMKILAYDPVCKNEGIKYVDLDTLLSQSDVISIHCPLNEATKHLINKTSLDKMKQGVMLINTSRGAILDTCAVIDALKSKKLGYLGMDVYEFENKLFFEDLSCSIIDDDIFERLLTFPNVLITPHQGFFTTEALKNIADTTFNNIDQFVNNIPIENEILND